MPSHQDIAEARDELERLDVKMNLADKLAKKGTKLAVPAEHPKKVGCTFIAYGEAPHQPRSGYINCTKMELRMRRIGYLGSQCGEL